MLQERWKGNVWCVVEMEVEVEVEWKDESRCFAKDVKSRAKAAKSIINSARRNRLSAFHNHRQALCT